MQYIGTLFSTCIAFLYLIGLIDPVHLARGEEKQELSMCGDTQKVPAPLLFYFNHWLDQILHHAYEYDQVSCHGKGKGPDLCLDTCQSATYMSQTRDQQRFTISQVAADWHKPMVPQRIMWPSIARANGQLDPRCSQQTHHRPNQPHYLHPVAVATTHFPSH